MSDVIIGPCCGCGTVGILTNVVMLSRRGGAPGRGWGCIICKLPSDGAIAMLCDLCMDAQVDPKFVCAGWATEPGRIPIADLPAGVFDHDASVDHEA